MYRSEGMPPGFLRVLENPVCMKHSRYPGTRSLKGEHGSAGEDATVLQRLENAARESLLCRRQEGSSW
jgi:hypothetical protein